MSGDTHERIEVIEAFRDFHGSFQGDYVQVVPRPSTEDSTRPLREPVKETSRIYTIRKERFSYQGVDGWRYVCVNFDPPLVVQGPGEASLEKLREQFKKEKTDE